MTENPAIRLNAALVELQNITTRLALAEEKNCGTIEEAATIEHLRDKQRVQRNLIIDGHY